MRFIEFWFKADLIYVGSAEPSFRVWFGVACFAWSCLCLFPKQCGHTEGFESIELVSEASGIIPEHSDTKWLLRNVHVRRDCQGSSKMLAAGVACGISPVNFDTIWLL